jgi:hypothetical protein
VRLRPLLAILGAGLRRNVAVTSAVVITAAVCLAMLGAGLLMRAEVRTINGYLLGQLQVVIDLTDDITPAERAALVADLSADPAVRSVRYEDKHCACNSPTPAPARRSSPPTPGGTASRTSATRGLCSPRSTGCSTGSASPPSCSPRSRRRPPAC